MYQELDPRRGPLTRDEKAFLALFVLLFLGFFIAEMVSEFTPQKMAIIVFMIAWMPLVALHEIGHALMARAFGWHVGEIVVGQGRPVWSFRLGRTHCELRMIPLTGFVRFVPSGLRWPRCKLALVYLAGPGIEILVALLLTFGVGWETMTTQTDHYGIITLQGITIAALTGAVLNLLPNGARTPEGFLVSDGLGFLRAFTLPDSAFPEMGGWEYRPNQRRWDRESLHQ